MVKSKRYFWNTPQAFVWIRNTSFALRVYDYNELVYFNRQKAEYLHEEQLLQDIEKLDAKEREGLRHFFEKYPTREERIRYWCKGIMHTSRTYARRLARFLMEEIERNQRFKEVSDNLILKKKEEGSANEIQDK